MIRAAILVLVGACANDDTGPQLIAAMPPAAAANAMVTLTGQRLCGTSADCTQAGGQIQIGLTLPAIEAVVVLYADTSAQIVIPPATPSGMTSLVVTVNDTASNALAFEVLP